MTELPPAAPSASNPPSGNLEAALAPFPYQLELVEYLRSAERDLWTWFASAGYLAQYAESIRHELLKATYRFDPAEHPRIYQLAAEAREALGLDVPITIYQATHAEELNAALAFIPGEAHIILHGGVTTLLTDDELKAALAHELTHYLLWDRFDRDLLVAHQMLGAMADHPNAAPSHLESARLFALYLEIHADRGSLFVMRDAMVTVRSLIKIQTGLADVHAESYLRQADEIFARERVKARQLTHPESFIRARALRDWSERGRKSFAETARMIEGTNDLESLDLVAQNRLSRVTRQLLAGFLAPKWFHTDAILGHARKFFPDFQPGGVLDEDLGRDIGAMDPSAQKYLAYTLLDFAVADPELEDVPIAAVLETSSRIGLYDSMLDLLGKELAFPKKRLAKLDKERAATLAAADRQAAGEPR